MLLVDEPVAGMTSEETERTAELLVSLAGHHSVIVVEHDMAFVRSIAKKLRYYIKALYWPKAQWMRFKPILK